MTETVQCPFCQETREVELSPVDYLTYHFLQFHTPWAIAKELAQIIYARKVVADPGR